MLSEEKGCGMVKRGQGVGAHGQETWGGGKGVGTLDKPCNVRGRSEGAECVLEEEPLHK